MRGVRKWSESSIKKRIKSGLGVGHGSAYKSAIRVQDLSSSAPQTRLPMLGRVAHLHSGLERALALVKQFESDLVEYRDQQPMDRAVTLGIAAQLGIRHPLYPGTNTPVVMTLDAVVHERGPDGCILATAYDVKPHEALRDERTLEKLSIHRAYCAQVGMPHVLFTEQSLPGHSLQNLDNIRKSCPKQDEVLAVPNLFDSHRRWMVSELAEGADDGSILEYCRSYAVRFNIAVAQALRLFQYLVWTHCVRIDLSMFKPFTQPLPRPQTVKLVDRFGECLA